MLVEGPPQRDRSAKSTIGLLLTPIPGLSFAAVVLASLVIQIGGRRATPDYGDLWRWSILVSGDGRLERSELFAEVDLVGHTSAVSIFFAHMAATRYSYWFLWAIGAVAIVGTVSLLGGWVGMTVAGSGTTSTAARVLLANLVGLSVVRFDVPGSLINSLLLFEQLYYLVTIMALLATSALIVEFAPGESPPRPSISADRSTLFGVARTTWLQVLIVGALVVGDAAASVLVVVLLAAGVAAAVIWRTPWSPGFRRVGLLALCSVAVRRLILLFVGAEPSAAEAIPGTSVRTLAAEILQLLGSSVASVRPLVSDGPVDGIYTAIGLALLVLWIRAVQFVVRRRGEWVPPSPLGAFLVLAFGYVTAAAVFIAVSREVTGAYDISRFARSTALAGAVTVLSVWTLVDRRRPNLTPARLGVGITIVVAVAILGLRLASFGSLLDGAGSQSVVEAKRLETICADTSPIDAWRARWAGFNEDHVAVIESSNHLYPALVCDT